MSDSTARSAVLARVHELHDSGVSLRGTARMLQAEGYQTMRGGTWTGQAVQGLLKSPLLLAGTPCSLCERRTTAKGGVCARLSCRPGYIQKAPSKEVRNERVRRGRSIQRGAPSVYAVWFPLPRILKTGFTEHSQPSIFSSAARQKATRRGWDTTGATCIWRRPGDTRTEAWMQASLAFRWWPAFEQKHNRVCEWVSIPDLSEAEVVAALTDLYQQVPPDRRTGKSSG